MSPKVFDKNNHASRLSVKTKLNSQVENTNPFEVAFASQGHLEFNL